MPTGRAAISQHGFFILFHLQSTTILRVRCGIQVLNVFLYPYFLKPITLSHMEANLGGCLYAFGKGSFRAILAILMPALLVYHYYDWVQAKWSGISELPVFQQMKDDFRSGAQVVGERFDIDLKHFYADTLSEQKIELIDAAPPGTHHRQTYWDKSSLANELLNTLPRGYHTNVTAYLNYIERYHHIAADDMERTKIPASVTLAQGLLESDAGRSRLARQANNHFGIKCRAKPGFRSDGRITDGDFTPHSLATDCMQAHDDYAWDRFEVYPSARESFRRHSMLLREPRYRWMLPRYEVGGVYHIPRKIYGHDEVPYYAAWCVGLKSSGYATARSYAEKLTLIIETYQLWKIDYEVIGG
jgi:hypothetical protein